MNVINKLPLFHSPTPQGEATRVGDVGSDAVRDLLRLSPVRFVIADVGAPLHWIPEADCFAEWKREIQPHLAEPGQPVYIDRFPEKYAYFASHWDDGSNPIIVLAKTH